jgi:hypothetical protein
MDPAEEKICRRPQDDKHRDIEKTGVPNEGISVHSPQDAPQNEGCDKTGDTRNERNGDEDASDFNLADHPATPS